MSALDTAATGSDRVFRLGQIAAVLLAVATALLSGALGVLPDILVPTSTPAENGARRLALSLLAGLGILCLLSAVGVMWTRSRLLRGRGTAYIVDAAAQVWETDAQQRRFFRKLEGNFSAVLHVPGPSDLDSGWKWPNDGPGAALWTGGVDDLVLSFRAVNRNDEQATNNNVMAWLPWPAAIAWTSRLLATDRGLTLNFRQRPSGGRQGVYGVDSWVVGTHDFTGQPTSLAPAAKQFARPAEIVVGPPTPGLGDMRPSQGRVPVRVLLLRATKTDWGPIEADDDGGDPVSLRITDYGDTGLQGTYHGELLEWRCPPENRFHMWADYPAIVGAAAQWVQANALQGGVTLLGTLIPQEVSLGLGVEIARRSVGDWPAHVWPLYKPSQEAPMVVVGLDLGWASLHKTAVQPR